MTTTLPSHNHEDDMPSTKTPEEWADYLVQLETPVVRRQEYIRAIELTKLDEREACATTADHMADECTHYDDAGVARGIAALIRER